MLKRTRKQADEVRLTDEGLAVLYRELQSRFSHWLSQGLSASSIHTGQQLTVQWVVDVDIVSSCSPDQPKLILRVHDGSAEEEYWFTLH